MSASGHDHQDDAFRYAALMRHRLTRAVIGDLQTLELVEEASLLFQVPMASVSIVGRTQVHFVAELGTTRHVLPRETALTTAAIRSDAPLVVEDAARDPRFRDHPAVAAFGIGFFAAAPLIDRAGYRLGAFLILDRQPRPFPPEDVALLVRFAARAMRRIGVLSAVAELSRSALAADMHATAARDAVEW